MLNVRLAIARGLTKATVKDLVALHVAMDVMVAHLNRIHQEQKIPKRDQKILRKYIRRLEYQMQDKWGFERNKERHTHWKKFDCLNPTEKMSTRVTS